MAGLLLFFFTVICFIRVVLLNKRFLGEYRFLDAFKGQYSDLNNSKYYTIKLNIISDYWKLFQTSFFVGWRVYISIWQSMSLPTPLFNIITILASTLNPYVARVVEHLKNLWKLCEVKK